MKSIIVTFLASLLITSAMAATDEQHYIATTADGKNKYDLTISSTQFSWKGLAGVDKGLFGSDKCKHQQLGDTIDVVQWKGTKYHTFNTLIIDQSNLKFVYSSLEKKQTILDNGTLEKVAS